MLYCGSFLITRVIQNMKKNRILQAWASDCQNEPAAPAEPEGIRGDIAQPSQGQPQHTITVTLTSPAPGQGPSLIHGQVPGPSGGGPGGGTSLIVNMPGVGSGIGLSSVTTTSGHGQVGMHYSGSAISATPMQTNIQPKGNAPQNYVMSGGQSLIVPNSSVLPSGGAGLASISAVGSNPNPPPTHGGAHYGAPIISGTSNQPNLAPKGSQSQNYGMSGNSMQGGGGQDSGDEGVPVSIHVSNNPTGGAHDSGPGSGASSDSHQSGQTEQRLKVEDALNYLDQVKYKFGNQPQVYNDFLDIMKEFKSQSIDTPGVISRVSNLFRGHPELIVGFNTFLPPGYKIEVQNHDSGSQISYRVDGVTSYVVTNMPQVMPTTSAQSSHPPAQQGSSNTSQIIQHTTPGGPVKNVSIQPGPASAAPVYRETGPSVTQNFVNPNIINVGVGVANGRSLSPVGPTPSMVSANNNYDSNVAPAFTHSFSSPFVHQFPSLQSQPVEFNHAINYVNKIKNRFHGQPDKYKQFLEILHTYQKEQRNLKEGLPPSSKHLTEVEVYAQVAKLFENQEDLLQEFGQFLPDATNHTSVVSQDIKPTIEPTKKTSKAPSREYNPPPAQATTSRPVHNTQSVPKRPSVIPTHPVAKKPKLSAPYKDVSFSEAARYGTLHDFAFFDKVKSTLRSQEVFDNFLRCLVLYNEEILSRQEVVNMVTPFFNKAPELLHWFKEFCMKPREDMIGGYEPLSQHLIKHDKITEEQALEIDFSTCKRLGASYCALPKNHVPPVCSGRTSLCKEVLNDVWVSFPTWSEDSTFVTSRKTQYEEYICRCEDERFELDVVIEANALTIKTFESVARKMARMTPEELAAYQLDEYLGSSSTTIHQRTVRRIYGDKASEIIEGIKKSPAVAIPIVLRRLKAKEEEWREAQRTFNKVWSEQVERFYLKSLDHQGMTFKQADIRALRSKSLIAEIETIFEEVRLRNEMGQPVDPNPHLALHYKDRTVLDDACNLLLHHVRRQSGIQKDDKRKIKQLLKHFVPDLFKHTRMELSDDENDDVSHDEQDDRKTPTELLSNGARNGKRSNSKRGNGKSKKDEEDDCNDKNKPSTSGSSSNNNNSVKGGEQSESRRTMAKRELKQILNENIKIKMRQNSDSKEVPATESEVRDYPNYLRPLDNDQDENYTRMIYIPHPDQDESYTLFFVNNAFYVFLRLHQILCERLARILETAAKLLANEPPDAREQAINSAAVALRMRPLSDIDLEDYYPTFLEMVRNLLDGVIDLGTFEDNLREMFGIHAYIAFTMDKVVTNAVRQLQTLVSDEVCQKCLDLFTQAQKNGGAGGLCATSQQRLAAEIAYQKAAEKAFEEENCIKVVIYQKSSRMIMTLIETDADKESYQEFAQWHTYIENYNKPETGDSKAREKVKPVFLWRNIRKWKKSRMSAICAQPNVTQTDAEGSTDFKPESETKVTFDESSTSVASSGIDENAQRCTKMEIDEKPEINPVTPEEAESLEKQLEINAKKRAEKKDQTSEQEMDLNSIDLNDLAPRTAPVTQEEAEFLETQLDINERKRREQSAILAATKPSPYIISEELQCKFNTNSYKLVFVVNSENFFYLKGALKRAKQHHKKVSTRLNDDFGKWHQTWLEDNVTEDQITRCEDWLISAKNSDTKIVSNNDINLPPYRPFNKYIVWKGTSSRHP